MPAFLTGCSNNPYAVSLPTAVFPLTTFFLLTTLYTFVLFHPPSHNPTITGSLYRRN